MASEAWRVICVYIDRAPQFLVVQRILHGRRNQIGWSTSVPRNFERPLHTPKGTSQKRPGYWDAVLRPSGNVFGTLAFRPQTTALGVSVAACSHG